MGLKVKNKKGPSLPPVDAGTYNSICVGIVDLGEQYSEKFKKYDDKVLIIWELSGVTVEVDGEEKPRWLSKDFSATLNEKSNLTKFLVPWRGKAFTEDELSGDGFNLPEMLGKGCFLQVTIEEKDGNQYNKINGVMGLPVGMPPPTTESELLTFDMDAWNDEVLEKLPEWIQDRIKKSTQYQKVHTPTEKVDFPDATTPPANPEAPPVNQPASPAASGGCPI